MPSYDFFLFTTLFNTKVGHSKGLDLDMIYYTQVEPLFRRWQEYDSEQLRRRDSLGMFESIENFLSNNL